MTECHRPKLCVAEGQQNPLSFVDEAEGIGEGMDGLTGRRSR